MSETEHFPLPEEVHELFLEGYVCRQCRDEAIRSVWRSKKAIKYGKNSENALRKAWSMVNELYPGYGAKFAYWHNKKQLVLNDTEQNKIVPLKTVKE